MRTVNTSGILYHTDHSFFLHQNLNSEVSSHKFLLSVFSAVYVYVCACVRMHMCTCVWQGGGRHLQLDVKV